MSNAEPLSLASTLPVSTEPHAHAAWLPRASAFHVPLRTRQVRIILCLGDLLCINLVFVTGLRAAVAGNLQFSTLLVSGTVSIMWLLFAAASHSYQPRRLSQPQVSVASAAKLMIATALGFYLLPLGTTQIEPWRALAVLLIAILTLGAWRIGFARFVTAPVFQRRIVIVGAGRAGRELARAIHEEDPTCQVLGFVDDSLDKSNRLIGGVPVLGSHECLDQIADAFPGADIVLAIRHKMSPGTVRAALRCIERGLRVVSLPDAYEEVTGRIPVEFIGERWLLALPSRTGAQGLYAAIGKRLLDLIGAAVGLILFIPFLPLLALIVKLDSPGPVFYRPQRLGRGGQHFRPLKLRTMVPEADRIGDPTFTASNDARITRVGRFLRRTHIDELPQLFNILRGEMSLVGPRPERFMAEFEEKIPFYRARYAVKPGATGWALINQGYAEGTRETLRKLEYDLYYVKHQSLYLDLVILAKTLRDVFTLNGR